MFLQAVCSIILYTVFAFPVVLVISFIFHDIDTSRHQLRDVGYISLISILPAVIAWLIFGSLKETEKLYNFFKWALLIASILIGGFLLFLSLVMDKKNELKIRFLVIGIILILLFFTFGIVWFNFNLTWIITTAWLPVLGWILFGILALTSLVLLIMGGYQIYDADAPKGILKIVIGLIAAGAATALTYYFLNNTAILNFCKWSIFIIIAALSIIYFWGSILFISVEGINKNRVISLIGGILGTCLALTIGNLILKLEWITALLNAGAWLPFITFVPVTVITAFIFSWILRSWSQGTYRRGSAIDRSGEWRIVGSHTKYKDATVRDMYDYRHGSGSWEKSVRSTIAFWRFLFILVSAFGFPVVILNSYRNTLSGILRNIYDAYDAYTITPKIILLGLLLIISIIINSRKR